MQNARHVRLPVATPGTSATVLLYQDSDGTTATPAQAVGISYCWYRFAMYLDQDVTFTHKWGPTLTTADADLKTIQTETLVKNNLNERYVHLLPGRNKITLTAGETAPTATVVAGELISFPGAVTGILG